MRWPRFLRAKQFLGTYSTLRPSQYRLRQFLVRLLCRKAIPAFASHRTRAQEMSVEPTRIEPASATVAGCCVRVTPGARRKFTHVLRELSRSIVTIQPSRVSKKELRRRIPVKSNIGFGAFPDFVLSRPTQSTAA